MSKIFMTLLEISAALCACASPLDMPNIQALGMIESGDDDKAIGKAGEVSRYQILKSSWKEVGFHNCTAINWQDEHIASEIAYAILKNNYLKLAHFLQRDPTDIEMFIVWNRGFDYFRKKKFVAAKVNKTTLDRAIRYSNLVYHYKSKN